VAQTKEGRYPRNKLDGIVSGRGCHVVKSASEEGWSKRSTVTGRWKPREISLGMSSLFAQRYTRMTQALSKLRQILLKATAIPSACQGPSPKKTGIMFRKSRGSESFIAYLKPEEPRSATLRPFVLLFGGDSTERVTQVQAR